MVEAVDVRTTGLGGDSEVSFARDGRLLVGPRKAMPLSLLAHQAPLILAELRLLAQQETLPDFPTQFAFRNPGRDAPSHIDGLDRRVWEALKTHPVKASTLVNSLAGLQALRRLADAGLATIAAFTPSDAMHVMGRQTGWNAEAARLGAHILTIEERNARAARSAVTADILCERVYEHVVQASGRIILETALAQDPAIEAKAGRFGLLGDPLIYDVVAGKRFSSLVNARIELACPLVAIGAPVGAYYELVASRLATPLSIPQHAAVCNAVGAVAGVVSQTVDIVINQPTFKVFRVHDPKGSIDFADADQAIAHARERAHALALDAALRAGASDPHVTLSHTERRAETAAAPDYLAEAIVRATATGRPLAGQSQPKTFT